MPAHLGTRIGHIGQHAGRSQEYIVLQDCPRVDRDIVLNLNVPADHRSAIDVDVLAYDAALPNSGALHNMGEMPYLRAGADLGAIVDVGRFMDKVGRCCLLPTAVSWIDGGASFPQRAFTGIEQAEHSQAFTAIRQRLRAGTE